MKRLVLPVLILLLLAVPLAAAEERFVPDETLATRPIRALASRDGSLAVGTRDEGLFLRRDGRWQRLRRDAGLALATDYVSCLSWSPETLWIGGWPGGLAASEAPFETSRPARREGLQGETVHAVVETLGRRWFATARGLFSSSGGAARPESAVNPAFPEGVFALAATEDALVVAGVGGRVARLEGTGWRAIDLPRAWAVSLVRDLASDGRRIWAATDRGLATWVDGRWSLTDGGAAPLPRNGVNCLAWDGRALWAGTWGQGLRSMDGERWSVFDESHGLPSPYVTCLHVSDRRIWVGTERGLVSKALDGPEDRNRPPSERIVDLMAGDDGAIVLASADRGAWRLGERGWERLASDELAVISLAGQGQSVWLGTTERGLWLHDGRGLRRVGRDRGLAGERILALRRHGRFLAVGTEAGFSLFDGVTWSSHTPENAGLPDHEIPCLAPAGDDAWVLGSRHGVTIVGDGRVLRRFEAERGELPSDRVLCLKTSPAGRILVGTDAGAAWIDAGLDGGTRSVFLNASVHDGLALDDDDWLLATSRGLARARGGRIDWPDGEGAGPPLRRLLRLGDDLWTASGETLRRRPLGELAGSNPATAALPVSFALGRTAAPGRRVFDCLQRGRRIWLATDSGLLRLDDETTRVFARRDGLCDDTVDTLASGGDDELFAAGASGVARLVGDRVDCHAFGRDGPRSRGLLLLAGRDGRALAVGAADIDEWDGRRWVPLPPSPRSADLPVGADRDDGGRWLLLLREGGLHRLDAGGWTALGPPPEGRTGGAFTALLRLADGTLFLGSENGMSMFRDGVWSRLRGDLGEFADARIVALRPGRDPETAWALGRSHLNLYLRGRWHALPFPDFLADREVLSLAPTPDGGLVLGCSDGALILEPRQ